MTQVTIPDQDLASFKESMASAEIKTWRVFIKNNAADAAFFANLNPPQGAGEFHTSNRADGRLDVFLFF